MKEFTSAAVRLHHLEEGLGKGYDEALKCLENILREKSSELAVLSSQVEAMSREKARLRDELVEVEAEQKSEGQTR